MEEDEVTETIVTPAFDLHSVKNSITSTSESKKPKEIQITGSCVSTRNLVQCSETEDDVIGTIYCNDWKEAVIGWRPAAPCVRYAWSSENKKRHTEGHGESKRSKGAKQQKPQPPFKEINWRSTVEPGTYHYSPGGRCNRRTIQPFPDDESNILEQLRDHFEKTLKCANIPVKLPDWGEEKKGESIPRRSVSEGTLVGSVVRTDSNKRRTSRHEHDLSESVSKEEKSSNHNQEGRNHYLQEYQVNKVQFNDPYLLEHHTSQYHEHHQGLVHSREGHGQQSQALTGWGSSKNLTLLNDADYSFSLNPLKKVTPKQRQMHDDNEAVTFTPSRKLDYSNNPEYSKQRSKENTAGRSKDKNFVLPTERFEQLCFRLVTGSDVNQSNLDNFSQSSRKDVSLAKEFQSIQDILQAQKFLCQQLKKTPDRKRYQSHQLRALPHHANGAGDFPGERKHLRESLHRGVIDRKTASELATELLPGVNGQRVHPLYADRIL